MTDEPTKIAVKRDGPRGWHWIARANYDPAVHVLHKLDPLDHDADGVRAALSPKPITFTFPQTTKSMAANLPRKPSLGSHRLASPAPKRGLCDA